MPQAVWVDDLRDVCEVDRSQLLTVHHETGWILRFDEQHPQFFQSQTSSFVDLVGAQFQMLKLFEAVQVSLNDERAGGLHFLLKGQSFQVPESVAECECQDLRRARYQWNSRPS